MLDITTLQKIVLCDYPFRWGRSDVLMSAVDIEELARTFPAYGFLKQMRLSGSDKTYSIEIRHAKNIDSDEISADGLSTSWKRFLDELVAPTYRATVAQVTGLNLDNAHMEIMFVRYGPNDWLSPHTDKYPKLATQLFYFSGDWQTEWGGNLVLLDGIHEENVAGRVIPRTGESVILVRSDCSWHMVEPVSTRAMCLRRSLQVNFWAHEIPEPLSGRLIAPPIASL